MTCIAKFSSHKETPLLTISMTITTQQIVCNSKRKIKCMEETG